MSKELWMTFVPEDPIGKKFFEIKEALGLRSRAEVVRHLVKTYDLESVIATFRPTTRKGAIQEDESG